MKEEPTKTEGPEEEEKLLDEPSGSDEEAETGSDKEAEPGSDKEAEPGSDKEAEPGSDKEAEPGSYHPPASRGQLHSDPPHSKPNQLHSEPDQKPIVCSDKVIQEVEEFKNDYGEIRSDSTFLEVKDTID